MKYCPLNNQKHCLGGGGVTTVIPRSFIPSPGLNLQHSRSITFSSGRKAAAATSIVVVSASLVDNPVVWAGRLCVYYALLKTGFAGSPNNPFLSSDLGTAGITKDSDLPFSNWLRNIRFNPDKEAADKRKLVSKWHPTTKGTLRRNYRIPSKAEGRRLLKAVAALLSEDDQFVDASSHKGCQIRRESAHGESVCCNNVRALFDELPTPHLTLEITPFPAGPLTDNDYAKAEKLERVLRSSPSV